MSGIQEFGQDLFELWGEVNTQERDPMNLVPLLETIHSNMPDDAPDYVRSWINDLHEDYMSGHIGPTFGEEAYMSMSVLQNMMSMDLKKYQGFDSEYSSRLSHIKNNLPRHPGEITIGDTRDISAPIRNDAEKANTWEEMDAVLGGIIEGATNNPAAANTLGNMLPSLSMYRFNLQQIAMQNKGISTDFGKTNGVHYLSQDIMNQARYMVHTASDILEDNHIGMKGFATAYQAGKQAYVARAEMDPNRASMSTVKTQSDYFDSFDEKLRSIHDIQQKMKDGESIFHRDSDEYKQMKDSVDKLMTAAEFVGFDFETNYKDPRKSLRTDDRATMDMLNNAMRDVYEKSLAYANKEAFKEKSTSRGIERKNTALALIELSKPDNVILNEHAVKDTRIDKKDKRTAVSLDQLMKEEIKNNRDKYRREIHVAPEGRLKPAHTPKTTGGRSM